MPPQLRIAMGTVAAINTTQEAAWSSALDSVAKHLASVWNVDDNFPENPSKRLLIKPGFSAASWYDPGALVGIQGLGIASTDPSPAKAVAALREQAHLLAPECWCAVALAWHFALLEALGPERFDRAAEKSGVAIDMGKYKNLLAPPTVYERKGGTPPVGAWVYFDNPGVTPENRKYWVGENAIKLGSDAYYAHPFGVVSEAEILEKLAATAHPGGPRPRRRDVWRAIDFSALPK